jgi:hypothetical protein
LVTLLIARAREWGEPIRHDRRRLRGPTRPGRGPTPLTRRRVDAGASFLITQASFDRARAGRGLAVTQRVLAGLAVERTHLYLIGARAGERMSELLG